MSNIKNSGKINKEADKDKIKFPKMEDIFHAPESAEMKEGRPQSDGAAESEQRADRSVAVSADSAPIAPTPVQISSKSPLLVEIESIMEENLQEIYRHIPDEAKQKFKTEGERTAGEIQLLISNFQATAKKILNLIRNWLKFVPGINRYFLEQESKIKTDKIMAIQLSKFQKK